MPSRITCKANNDKTCVHATWMGAANLQCWWKANQRRLPLQWLSQPEFSRTEHDNSADSNTGTSKPTNSAYRENPLDIQEVAYLLCRDTTTLAFIAYKCEFSDLTNINKWNILQHRKMPFWSSYLHVAEKQARFPLLPSSWSRNSEITLRIVSKHPPRYLYLSWTTRIWKNLLFFSI